MDANLGCKVGRGRKVIYSRTKVGGLNAVREVTAHIESAVGSRKDVSRVEYDTATKKIWKARNDIEQTNLMGQVAEWRLLPTKDALL